MAERRMFAKSIVTSDAFGDMPPSARCLYFMLGMFADDDGFVNSPRAIMRQSMATDDDMKLLIAKRFVIVFDDGVVVIKHWRIHNYIAKDRYKPTTYIDHKEALSVDENGAYTEKKQEKRALYTDCIQPVYKPYTQEREGKDRIGKDRIDESAGAHAHTREEEPNEGKSALDLLLEEKRNEERRSK